MAWHLAPSLVTLRDEINALCPNRDKRTDGTISGYPGARSSHNYNSAGVVCALDITTGDYDGGISPSQGRALAEDIRLRLRDQPRGIPAYVIHNGLIATAGTNWAWDPYGGIDPHTSHIHVSVDWDIYTGGYPSGQADYDTTLSWNLGTLSGQGGTPLPIEKKDWFDMATSTELRTIVREEVELINRKGGVHAYRNPKDGPDAWGYITGGYGNTVKIQAELAAIKGLVSQLAGGQDIDYDRIDAGVKAALAEGIKIEGTLAAAGGGE